MYLFSSLELPAVLHERHAIDAGTNSVIVIISIVIKIIPVNGNHKSPVTHSLWLIIAFLSTSR